ncbi:MAG TPA: sensor histidine kinase [Flavobacteriales bacterium]
MSEVVAILSALGYLGLLFGVAWFAEYRQRRRKSIIASPYVYALSMAVYCTAWTYYGSVGRASTNGMEFVAIYVGSTIMCALFVPVLGRIIRICNTLRITSLADLISTRYGKNFSVAIAVTVFCVLGIIPYIALQLKAITVSFDVLTGGSSSNLPINGLLSDSTFWTTVVLALFIMLYGNRSIDSTERHEGLVAAVAFESIIKLVAFVAVGLFVTYGLFNGAEDLFSQALKDERLQPLFTLDNSGSYAPWMGQVVLAAMSLIFLPRQFQVSVIENLDQRHLAKATWMFPLYLLVINLFVLPIAFGGMLLLGDSVPHDVYVLALPLHFDHAWLGLFIFIGGFSAATSMIMVETIALTTMVSNNLVMPALLSARDFKVTKSEKLSSTILNVRRISIVVILGLAFIYEKTIAQHATLVSIGLISFVAVAQFAPAVFGGLIWKGGSQRGAMAGLCTGFVLWVFTLVVPSLSDAGLIGRGVMTDGLFGLWWLKPYAFLGLEGLDPVTHGFFWSTLLNLAVYVVVSLQSERSAREIYYGELFVDAYKHGRTNDASAVWRGTAYVPDLRSLLANFIPTERADRALNQFARRNNIVLAGNGTADPRLVTYVERVLSGIIGSASARIMVASVVKEEELGMDEVFDILRGSQQLIVLNKELRQHGEELDRLTQELRKVNDELRRSDELKDEFLYTVTHELRTPLTSIRALSEILHDNPALGADERQQFLVTVTRETERLTRLIEQVLDLEKFESGKQKLEMEQVRVTDLIDEAVDGMGQLLREQRIELVRNVDGEIPPVVADRDRILQVLINLLSNAIKFSAPQKGRIQVFASIQDERVRVSVRDNGHGVEPALRELIFEKFFQVRKRAARSPVGSGLGLAISKKIIDLHGGTIRVESDDRAGAEFTFTLPLRGVGVPTTDSDAAA